MIVRTENRSAVVSQRRFDDFARMHARSVDGAAEEFLARDQAVALVEVQETKDFVLKIRETQS